MRRFFFTLFVLICSSIMARAETFTILALGDSLTAGLGLEQNQAFPAKLEAALKAKGKDVTIINAGVSGDTAAQGEQRLDWALTDDVDAAIVELGANDALRGLPPEEAEKALTIILDKLAAKKLPVLLTGMLAPPNLGPDYAKAFEGMYQRLAAKPGVIFYPFFLDGVAADASLNQSDGIHPTAKGVDVIVARMLPYAEKLLPQ
jgi:acyl-CoA thioesterase I